METLLPDAAVRREARDPSEDLFAPVSIMRMLVLVMFNFKGMMTTPWSIFVAVWSTVQSKV